MIDDTLEKTIDWHRFHATRERLGPRFFDRLSYFQQDAPRSIEAMERAMQVVDAARMIVPANRLAEDAELFGADALTVAATHIQMRAQACLAQHWRPDELLPDILYLRPLYERTMAQIEEQATPLVMHKKRAARAGGRRRTVRAHAVIPSAGER